MRFIITTVIMLLCLNVYQACNAQSTPPPKPFENPVTDANGVNIITGGFSVKAPSISMNNENIQNGSLGMSGSIYNSLGSPSYLGSQIRQLTFSHDSNRDFDIADVTIDGNSHRFSGYSLILNSDSKDGSELVDDSTGAPYGHFTFTARDGSKTSFEIITEQNVGYYRYVADKTAHPNGVTVKMTYAMCGSYKCLQSVKNNLGYSLYFLQCTTGGLNCSYSIIAVNQAYTNCYDYNSCINESFWPAMSITRSANNANVATLYSNNSGESVNITNGINFPSTVNVTYNNNSSGSYSYRLEQFRDINYFPQSRVIDFHRGSFSSHYSYNADIPTVVTVTDQDNRSEVYELTSPGVANPPVNSLLATMKSYKNKNGDKTSFLSDDLSGTIYRISLPEGNYSYHDIDYRGNIIKKEIFEKNQSQSSKITSTYDYGSSYDWVCGGNIICNKPRSFTDSKGNTANYTYDSAHGGILTETLPADSSGVQAVKRFSYTQRYAWVQNGSGGYVRAGDPIWVLTGERVCRATSATTNGCAGGSADEVVTAYDYGPDSGPNNLLVRGVAVTADGVTRRTCYGYDMRGNRISETKPRAGLAVCS